MHKSAYLIVLLLFMTAPSFAQPKKPFFDIPDENMKKIIEAVRPKVSELKISENEFVGQETPEQLADPLLTPEEAEAAVVRGIISSTAEWCGLDWKEQSFAPFMSENRASGKTPKQMAYTGALHGFGMRIMEKQYKQSSCKNQPIAETIKEFLY